MTSGNIISGGWACPCLIITTYYVCV